MNTRNFNSTDGQKYRLTWAQFSLGDRVTINLGDRQLGYLDNDGWHPSRPLRNVPSNPFSSTPNVPNVPTDVLELGGQMMITEPAAYKERLEKIVAQNPSHSDYTW